MHGGEIPFGGGQTHGGEQVLGGGEIPVGGPQQMALMFEMIKGMQQNQVELAESLRQLREANANKEDHHNKNDNRNHEERESHNKNDTPFVTMSDVADLLKQERERPPKEPRHFVRRPPYPIELLKEPYPEKYDTPVFALFDGRKGSAMEHISKFLDSMGPFAAHGDLCLREFSKSLVDRAYTWYTVLPAGSIRTWEDMVESFCSKYFHVEEKITLVNLHSTKQQIGEDLVKYIHRFRDVSLDCHVKYQEGELVESSLKLKRAGTRRVYRRLSLCPPQPHPAVPKRKNPTDKAYEEPPPLPFTAEEMMAIFDKWVQDQVIKLPKISKQPTPEEQKDPKYCRYHRYVNHSTVDCRTLRWEVNRKIQNGTLLLSEEQQKVHQTPFPNYNKGKGKAVVSVVIHGNVSDMEAEESAAASSSLVPAAVRTLQKSPKFKSLFNQLGFGPEARNAATEALITIAAESGATCFTAEAHASRAFLETTNAITFTDEDMEVQYPDHRRPLYLSAVIKDVQVRRALVDTGSCLNLIPLSTLQAVNLPHQKIQGSPMEVTGFGRSNLSIQWGIIHGRTIHRETMWNTTPLHGKILKMILKLIYGSCFSERRKGKNVKLNMGVHHNACVSNSPMDASSIAYEGAWGLIAHSKRPTAMSSEGSYGRPCTVYGNESPRKLRWIRQGPWQQMSRKAAEDQTESTTTNPEESTVDHSRSTVMNSEEEDAVDQTEPTARKRKDKPISISKSLSTKERKCLIDLLHEYKDVFAWDYHEMPGIDPGLVAHSLNVEPGTRPVVQPMRTFHTEVEAQITQEVKKLLAAGFIKPIQHPRWLSNIVPVKKKNGQIRCCVDFRNLNKACPKDEFPLPNMDLLIDSAAGHAMFSFMDGFSGYNQIRMSTRDAEKTAFRTPIGNFYYTVMPFDYVDDIVVKSKKREDHLRILRKVFDRCRLYKLKMNPLKCAFGVSAGKFLGFLVHNRGIDVDPAKASAIATMKAPTSHKELKSFLGRLSYIRRFIPGLAAVTATFMPLMKKGVPFVWSTACQQAFEKIQLIMTKLPTVCAPVPGRPLRLYLASNSEAIGGLVAQEDEDGTEKPIYYVSRALRDAETRYSGAERACLALIYASQRLRHYFLAHKIQLITKSHPIRSLLHRPVLSGRLAQWLLQLSQYEITTETPTAIKSQAIADLLAQFPGEDSSSISHEVPGEIGEALLADLADSTWTLKFDGFFRHLAQTKGEFSLKEPSLALYRALAQKLEEKFDTFEISHAMRCENRYADALATLGSQVSFEGSKVDVTIDKRSMPITDLLREKFKEQNLDAEDWRTPIRAKLHTAWRSLSKMREPPRSSKEADRSPRETSQAATRLKKLATRYFVEGGILFRKGFHGDPLRCLSLAESQTVMKEAHSGECGEHQGKKRLYQLLLTLGYYWPTMKKDTADFVKSCHTCQLQANLIHTHPTSLQNMATPWPFHTWGLDLIGPINPSSGGYIWILVATEYFSKWVEAVPLRKATGAAVANFIREHIITRFGIPHKIISDNGTPFVNKNVREVLEHYRIKHRRSTPYYPQGNGQAEATNRMLLRILSKMVFDYGKGWSSHLADTLWAYRGSTKTATGFTPFSLVYGTDAISPTELLVPSPRILHGMDLEADADICAEARVADLEGLEEARELAQVRSLRYHQKLADAYEKTLQTRIFAKGQMVLKTVDHVRRGLPSPSKFAPNWEGPYLIREAYDSGYYKLSTADGTTLVDPINGKWLKRYYS
uniref:Integrase catalytic domain-containing protein n=1 Tax=Fagus sylvatica TaxID=28930 RepID=A0A2N9F7A0_FAGSY